MCIVLIMFETLNILPWLLQRSRNAVVSILRSYTMLRHNGL